LMFMFKMSVEQGTKIEKILFDVNSQKERAEVEMKDVRETSESEIKGLRKELDTVKLEKADANQVGVESERAMEALARAEELLVNAATRAEELLANAEINAKALAEKVLAEAREIAAVLKQTTATEAKGEA
jgi:hypothetical protein